MKDFLVIHMAFERRLKGFECEHRLFNGLVNVNVAYFMDLLYLSVVGLMKRKQRFCFWF